VRSDWQRVRTAMKSTANALRRAVRTAAPRVASIHTWAPAAACPVTRATAAAVPYTVLPALPFRWVPDTLSRSLPHLGTSRPPTTPPSQATPRSHATTRPQSSRSPGAGRRDCLSSGKPTLRTNQHPCCPDSTTQSTTRIERDRSKASRSAQHRVHVRSSGVTEQHTGFATPTTDGRLDACLAERPGHPARETPIAAPRLGC
jgi:hypothetical protein